MTLPPALAAELARRGLVLDMGPRRSTRPPPPMEYDRAGRRVPKCPAARMIDALAELAATEVDPARRLRADADTFAAAVAARDWETAVALLAPDYATAEPSDAHRQMWAWWVDLVPGERPRPLVACLARGAAKSSTLVLMTALTACQGHRSFVLWVHARHDKATEAVGSVAELLQRPIVQAAFPKVAQGYTTSTGQKRDNRISRYRTASGFTIDAAGLDSANRGSRIDQDRPTLLVLDDVEDEADSPLVRSRKLNAVAKRYVPMLATDGAVAFAQNRIGDHSIMASVLDGSAEILTAAKVIGPVPQILDLEYEARTDDELEAMEAQGLPPYRWRITKGTPTWEGQDLATSEEELNDMGPDAFRSEKQHESNARHGGAFDPDAWQILAPAEVPKLLVICRGWDIAATEEGTSKGDPDYSVGALLGLDRHRRPWLLDVVRGRWSPDQVEARIRALHEADTETLGRKVPLVLEAQPGAAGKLYAERWARALDGLPWETVSPSGSKADRAATLISTQRRGELHLAAGPWVSTFTTEADAFPLPSVHDDQVDAVVHAYRWCLGESEKRKGARVRTPVGTTITGRYGSTRTARRRR